jgi:flagellar biosynthesis/type III secretory pathway M-ring protein FliF/YscJ
MSKQNKILIMIAGIVAILIVISLVVYIDTETRKNTFNSLQY